MKSLRKRVFVPEKMDFEDVHLPTLLRTVRQFTVVNRLFSRSASVIEALIIAPNRGTDTPISIVDVGGGGGDIMRATVRRCRKAGIACEATVLDKDERILAQTRAACAGFDEIRVEKGDLSTLAASGPFDYVFSNHFLHHFPDAEVPGVLRAMYDTASRALIVNDLYRSAWALFGFTLFAGAFFHRSFAAFDGRLSIRKGFREPELQAFVDAASIPEAHIFRRAPARVMLTAVKPAAVAPSGKEIRL